MGRKAVLSVAGVLCMIGEIVSLGAMGTVGDLPPQASTLQVVVPFFGGFLGVVVCAVLGVLCLVRAEQE